LHVLEASSEHEFDIAFANIVQERIEALHIASDNFFNSEGSKLGTLVARHAIPSIFAYRAFALSGGLASYGPSMSEACLHGSPFSSTLVK
jgi:putative tryptophan/tyrosine transport system substrate-binding protein